MKRQGKVIQIILNKDLDNYMFEGWVVDQMIKTKKDLVVLENSDYPKGLKGYFLSFKRDAPESFFPILTNAKGIKEGDTLTFKCKRFKVECFCYEDK